MNDFSELQYQLTQLRIQQWVNHEFLSLQWCLLILFWILPWIFWWKTVDKGRIIEILLYGLICAYLSTLLDATGTELRLWGYAYKEIPLYNRLMITDTGILPVSYMLMYQYLNSWRHFLVGHVILACIFSFICEPLLTWLKVYNVYHWKHIYSLPIYILLGVIIKLILGRLNMIQTNKQKNNG